MDTIIDPTNGARCFQTMVPMRDGTRLNTFLFLPPKGGPRFPVILHRTPYGITVPQGQHVTDCTKGWLPDPETPLRGRFCEAGARSCGAAMPPSIKIAADATAPKVRTMSTVMMRPMVSVGPPAAAPTIIVIGRVG